MSEHDKHDEDAAVERIARIIAGGAKYPDEAAAMRLAAECLSALRPGDRLPGGLVVVPVHATDKMLDAANAEDSYHQDWETWRDACERVYDAMLAASTD